MRIVDRATFLAMPAGTVFAKYAPCVFEELLVKGDSIIGGSCGDFFYKEIADAVDARSSGEFADMLLAAQESGASIPMDFDVLARDGCFDADQLFAVWEKQDVEQLIKLLQGTIT